MTHLTSGFACLDHLALLEIKGNDAAEFLHNQLSQNILTLNEQHAVLAVYCNNKGRAIASCICLKTAPQCYWLILSKDLATSVSKRLQMFVLRSRLTISDISTMHQFFGYIGNIKSNLNSTSQPLTYWDRNGDYATYQTIQLYPAAQHSRCLWIVAQHFSDSFRKRAELGADAWHYSEILSGITTINQLSSEEYVPQMLNYESVGGINFKKGCYPGQEIIARSQFRGTIKRRAFIATTSEPVAQKTDVFCSNNPRIACGSVAQTASYEQQQALIVCLQLNAIDSLQNTEDYLFCYDQQLQQIKLSLLPLPYKLLEEI